MCEGNVFCDILLFELNLPHAVELRNVRYVQPEAPQY